MDEVIGLLTDEVIGLLTDEVIGQMVRWCQEHGFYAGFFTFILLEIIFTFAFP